METPEERMPGGRWLPVPGTNFKSAAYALAVGVAALVPGKKHLDWSDLTDEKMLYDILKPLCNSQTSAFLKKEGAKFDPERPMSMELPSLVIQTWNAKMPHKAKVHMSCDGQNIVIPSRGTDIYIRCTGHRWEAYGHFEDTATTTSPAKAASTLSNITHIEIKPATVSESPSVAAISVTASSILPKDVNDVVMMMSKLCNASSDILPATTNLQSQIEMLDASTKKFTAILRPCLLRTSSDDISEISKSLIEQLRVERIKSGRRNPTYKLVTEPTTPAAQASPKSLEELAAAAHSPCAPAQGSKSSSRDEQVLHTFSPIIQADIKPIANMDKPADARIPRPSFEQNLCKDQSIEAMTAFLRKKTSFNSIHSFEELCSGLELLGVSRREAIRPTVGLLCSQLIGAGIWTMRLKDRVEEALTSEEKQKIVAKMNELAKKEEPVEQEREEDAEQKGDEVVKQKEDADVKRKQREKANAAAAAYAAQDRDDSCSDSD